MAEYRHLSAGDMAPWFAQRTFALPRLAIHKVGGRYAVLCLFGSAADPHSRAAIEAMAMRPGFFDDRTGSFFGVSADPRDEAEARVSDCDPGYHYFLDFNGQIGRLYGALPLPGAEAEESTMMRRRWVVLDPTLRVLQVIPFAPDQSDIAAVLDAIDRLPPPEKFAGFEVQAPILVLPGVFERAFCDELIGLYERHGGADSGFMREIGGKSVIVNDYSHKPRKDYIIEDRAVILETQARFMRRVVPMIDRAHQFKATRMERYIVGCYAAEDEAHFMPHRDNTTKGTAHRRFAVSVNLNDDFDGGEVSFPEYGPRGFKAPVGGAVVFSCSLLHAVSKVTRGRRYAFLPFLYDEAAARAREANAGFVAVGGDYKASTP